MKKEKYQKAEIAIIAIDAERMFCTSGNISNWTQETDNSDDDNWTDDDNSNNYQR